MEIVRRLHLSEAFPAENPFPYGIIASPCMVNAFVFQVTSK